MTVGQLVLLAIAGIGTGIVGSTAGLASLVSYPALLAVGLPPVIANVTNTVALIGSSIGSVSRSRRELRGLGADIRRLIPIAVLAGAAGAALLLLTPSDAFEAVVPYLIVLASVLLLAGPRLRALRRAASGRPGPSAHTAPAGPSAPSGPSAQATASAPAGPAGSASQTASAAASATQVDAVRRGGPAILVGLALSFVYGGYFGAAAGVMVVALLLLGTDLTLPRATALRNLLLGLANMTAALGFAIFADVRWSGVLPLGLGCVVGGMIGPTIVRRVPPTVLRVLIATGGFALALRLWLS